jgi:hypothetical protein
MQQVVVYNLQWTERRNQIEENTNFIISNAERVYKKFKGCTFVNQDVNANDKFAFDVLLLCEQISRQALVMADK